MWICAEHGPYRQSAKLRAAGAVGCAKCRAKSATPISGSHPELAAQWHPQHNGGLSPEGVSRGSSLKVWWVCETHGAFQA